MIQAVPRPNDDEFAPFYADYIARVSSGEISTQELAIQRDRVCQLLAPVSEVQGNFRYAPDKWSVKEVVGHIGDTERVFAYRLLRIARADETPQGAGQWLSGEYPCPLLHNSGTCSSPQ